MKLIIYRFYGGFFLIGVKRVIRIFISVLCVCVVVINNYRYF